MTRAAWIRSEQSAHSRALGAAQAFPLIGDGEHDRAVYTNPRHATMNGELAPALAEARYKDWIEGREKAHPKRRRRKKRKP